MSCVKNAFQNFAENEATKYHRRTCKTAKYFSTTFENPAQAVNHGEERKSNYERNVHILKMIIEALILCAEQGLALRGNRDHMKKVYQQNVLAIVNTFAKFDTIIKDQCSYNHNAKMSSWNVRNDIISCLAKFVENCIKEHISESTY